MGLADCRGGGGGLERFYTVVQWNLHDPAPIGE